MKTGIANLPLHNGKCPRWLFPRMVKLAEAVSEAIVDEYGQKEFLKRLSNPFWFQGFGCILGFDWHSSGLTTTTCGALKEALKKQDLGIKTAGGKGKASRKAQKEIENTSLSTKKIKKLKYSSKISAKIDNSCVQDNYNLYHHFFIFNEKGNWAVIQQGMNHENNYARRYHWLSDDVIDFVNEPHSAICGDKKEENVLNLTSKYSEEARKISVDIINDKIFERFDKQRTLIDYEKISFPKRHFIIDMNKRDKETLRKAYEIQPKNYEELVVIKGIGPKSIRSLALISDLIYGKKASWQDPVKYSFAHGGKDNIPYPVDKINYDHSIKTLKESLEAAKIGDKERLDAIKRLKNVY